MYVFCQQHNFIQTSYLLDPMCSDNSSDSYHYYKYWIQIIFFLLVYIQMKAKQSKAKQKSLQPHYTLCQELQDSYILFPDTTSSFYYHIIIYCFVFIRRQHRSIFRATPDDGRG